MASIGRLLRQDEATSQTNVSGFAVFAYDPRGRLYSENRHWQTSAQTNFDLSSGYSFDTANNLQAGGNGWSVNSSNQVTSAPYGAGSAGLLGATGLTYDASGNTHTFNGATLGYDVWGNLSSLTLPGGATVSYLYDSSGRRIGKTVGGATTYYLYDGDTLLAEMDANGNIVRAYTWGPTGLVSDSGAVGFSVQTRLYLFDAMGNTRALVDGGSGSLLWEGAWTAWGQPNCASAPPSAFGYHGQTGAYLDTESGLLQMGARYYAPCIGRFLTRDPAGYSAGGNLYAFCMGDPVNFFDPDGCEPFPYASQLQDTLSHAVGHAHDPITAGLLDTITNLPKEAAKAGTAQGRFDSGKISAGELAMAYGEYGLALADAAFTIVDGVKMALPCHLGGHSCFVVRCRNAGLGCRTG